MNWDAIGATGEWAGAIAVVATLVYLSMQVRQNTKSMGESRELAIAQNYENRSQAAAQHFLQKMDSPYFKETSLFLTPDSSENEVSKQRMIVSLRWWMTTTDNIHYQYEKGFADQDYYETSLVSIVKMAAPKWRAAGIEENRTSFKIEVDRILAEADDR
jgi:hypothetical protein